jgi:hypothetical protein
MNFKFCFEFFYVNQQLAKKMSPSNEQEREDMSNVPYQELIRSLMHLVQCTRPDLAFTVGTLSKFNKNPGNQHWIAAKRVLRYLRGTSKDKLTFEKNSHEIVGNSDADWLSKVIDRFPVMTSLLKEEQFRGQMKRNIWRYLLQHKRRFGGKDSEQGRWKAGTMREIHTGANEKKGAEGA